MNNRRHGRVICTALAFALCPGFAWGQVTGDAPGVRPDAIVDLKTDEGMALVKGRWRYRDVKVIEVDHHSPGADLAPSGPPNRTQDIDVHAGAADFDDTSWEQIKPAQLEERRSTGRLCFNWYRTRVTVPSKVGSFDPTGATVVFEIAIDDYAEIWVDGKLPLVLGQAGGQLIKGFNAPNRVMLTRNARVGQTIQLAVFGINGPLSNPPGNFIWVRSATLDFYKPNQIGPRQFVNTEIVTVDPSLDQIIAPGTQLERLAGGFLFTEGPVWVPATANSEGYLLFSDPNRNMIYKWTPDGEVSVFRERSGYSGADVAEYRQPGSNGLSLDPKGRLTIC
ncbi:MAG: SMP-30/gluconolactonase/LRE family protein, partial [Nitrospira defluvii]|nr:SMP-30/gluconolactonase/LRE family protein [Nitrospira defluvii]